MPSDDRHTAAPDAFGHVLELVEHAKEALVAAVPSPRGVAGVALAEAILGFEERLRDAAIALGRSAGRHRDACEEAIGEALARAERLRLDAPRLDYEGLVAVLADLLEPLDAFDRADRELGVPDQSTRRRWPSSSSGTS